MKRTLVGLCLLLTVFTGCATMKERENPSSSFIIAYFKPPEGDRFGGGDIRPFGQVIAAPLQYSSLDEGYYYAANVSPGKYYIQSVDMFSLLGRKTKYYFGTVQIGGYEQSSFTVGSNEVKFLGAFTFEETGKVDIFGVHESKIVMDNNITAKDCIKYILNKITAATWKQRLTEELNRL